MPSGKCRKTEVTANSSRMPGSVGWHEAIRVWGRRGPPQVVFDQLKRVLRLDNVISWMDPCASTCRLAKLLISPKYTVRTNAAYTGTFDGVHTEAQLTYTTRHISEMATTGSLCRGFYFSSFGQIIRSGIPISSAYNGQSYLFLCS